VIEFVWSALRQMGEDLAAFLAGNFDPVRDSIDLLMVFLAVYWLLMLIKGTRAVQILVGVLALIAVKLFADLTQLMTVSWILDNFFVYAVLIVIILFQNDIRRALARVGRGVFPRMAERQESQLIEEIVRAAQTLAQRRVGALIVLERETGLEDLIQVGTAIEARVSKDLLVSLFLPYSPLHDGAVIIQEGRIANAGCVLPLTLRTDLPEGLGTRHRAAVGITEESDAVVIVVSEETASISVVAAGQMIRDLDGPKLRAVLQDLFVRGRREATPPGDAEAAEEPPSGHTPADASSAAGGG
jgi:diadenylate cyclase